MLVPITGIYIALLALVGLALQQHVGTHRYSEILARRALGPTIALRSSFPGD